MHSTQNTDLGPLFTATGADAPRADLPFVERHAITAVVYNQHTNTYLGLQWKDINWETFVTGGVEDGQTPEQAARTEILEETGYSNLRLICELPRYQAKFFHGPKQVNRHAFFDCFLFELVTEEQNQIAPDELQKHTCVWLTPEAMRHFRLPEGHRYIANIAFAHIQQLPGNNMPPDTNAAHGIINA